MDINKVFRVMFQTAWAILFVSMHVPLLSQEYKHGTAIVIFRMTDTIYAAADSKVQSDNPLVSSTGCKIRTVGDIGIALAGLYSEQASRFDVVQIAIEAARSEGTIFQKMETLERAIRQPLISAWSNILKRNPLRIINDYNSQIAFFGFYEGVPFVIRDWFYPAMSFLTVSDMRIERMIVPRSSSRETPHLVFLAQSKEINDALEAAPFSVDNWTQALNRIIQFAIDKRHDVGPPVDILLLTRSGKKWIQKKDECPE
jgi:hypothetical protein